MSRKSITFTIEAEGRDKDKVFVITEMSAWKGFDWASRVFFAIMNAGVTIPESLAQSGIAGIAHITGADFGQLVFSTLAKVPHYTAKPILDELMQCVKISPGEDSRIIRDLVENDIEEILTILSLQKEAFKLHFDFFAIGGQSTTASATAETAA